MVEGLHRPVIVMAQTTYTCVVDGNRATVSVKDGITTTFCKDHPNRPDLLVEGVEQ